MDHVTVLPFLLAMFIGVATMPTNVVQVCYGEMGHEHEQPWRASALAPVAHARAAIGRAMSWLKHPLAVPLGTAAALAIVACVAPDSVSDVMAAVVPVVGLKSLRQARADINQAQARLRAEGRELLGVPASNRTADQKARIDAIEQEMTALDAQAVENATEISRAERFSAADVVTARVEVGHDRSLDRPWGPEVAASAPAHVQREAQHIALGTFAQAVRAQALGQAADPRLLAAATGAGVNSDSNLGFAVPMEVAPGLEREMYEGGEVMGRCDIRTISGNAITYNRLDETSRADSSRQGGVLGYWVDEGTAPTASNTKLDKMELKLRKVGAFGVMTDELLSDASALGGELQSAFSKELIFQVENKVWRGNGAAAPLGFMSAPCLVSVAKETNQAAATINTKNLSKMWARMPASSKRNSVWFINVDCEPQLDELTLPAGTAALQPRFVDYGPDGILRIKGRPVIPVEYAETLGTQGDIALVDMSRYRLIRKGGVEQASSMHVYFSAGEQAFRAFYRVDGKPVPKAAMTPFKGSGTLSPFVVLDTRS